MAQDDILDDKSGKVNIGSVDIDISSAEKSLKKLEKEFSDTVENIQRTSKRFTDGVFFKRTGKRGRPKLREGFNFGAGLETATANVALGINRSTRIGSNLISDSTTRAILEMSKTLAQVVRVFDTQTQLKNVGLIQQQSGLNYQKGMIGRLTTAQARLDNIEQEKELVALQTKLNNELDKTRKKTQDELNKTSKWKTLVEKVRQGFSRVSISIPSLFKGFLSFVTLRKFSQVFKAMANYAGDYIENLNLVEQAFGDNAKAVAEWAIDYGTNMGLAITQVQKFAGSFQTLANTMGVAQKVSEKMSLTLTKLTYDVASLRNLDFESAFSKIESTVFAGQLKTSRTIGIDISIAGLDKLLDDLGILNVQARELGETEKIYLRFIKTIRSLETAGAFGDLAKTLTSVTNRIRVFQSSWKNLWTTIGTATSGFISDGLAKAIAVVQALTVMVQQFWALPTETTYSNWAKGIGEVTESVDDLNESMGLLNIDKFNVISGAGDAEKNAGISDLLAQEAENAANAYEKATAAAQKYDEEVRKIRNNILKWIFPKGVIGENGEFIIDEAKTLNGTFQALSKIAASLSNSLDNVFKIMVKIAPVLGDIIEKVLGVVAGIVEWLDKNNLLAPAIETLLVGGAIFKLVSGIKSITGGVIGLKMALVALTALAFFKSVSSFLESLDGVDKKIYSIIFMVLGLGMAIAGVILAIKSAAKGLWGLIGLVGAGAGLATFFAGLKGTISSYTSQGVDGYANSGIPKQGSLFYAGEGTRPEILYNAGGRTNVIDSDILGETLYQAQIRANNATGGGGKQMVAKLVINGKELADATFNDFDYYGKRTRGRGI